MATQIEGDPRSAAEIALDMIAERQQLKGTVEALDDFFLNVDKSCQLSRWKLIRGVLAKKGLIAFGLPQSKAEQKFDEMHRRMKLERELREHIAQADTNPELLSDAEWTRQAIKLYHTLESMS